MLESSLLETFIYVGAAITAAGFLKSSVFVVRQQTAAIIETFGKYSRTAKPGLGFKLPYPISKVATCVDMRLQQSGFEVDVRTNDNAFLKIPVSLHYRVTDAYRSYYELDKPVEQMAALAANEVRTKGAKMSFSDIFNSRDALKQAIDETLREKMTGYGFQIENVVVAQPEPSKEVRAAFDRVIASQRLKEAAENEAEASKIRVIAEAQARAEAMKLHGKGIADQRTAIAKGSEESMELLKKGGLSVDQSVALMVVTNGQDVVAQTAKNPAAVILAASGGNSELKSFEELVSYMKALGNAKRPEGAPGVQDGGQKLMA